MTQLPEHHSTSHPDSHPDYQPKEYVTCSHPDWSKNATIYEVNIRQYTPEGTFEAFAEHLSRLKKMGVDILWLMPIHPIGIKNRKGSLGSYYAVRDYLEVNPEFGTAHDFRSLVEKIHEMGMYVILDWVANHSAWDNPLTESNPEWYTRTKSGEFQPTPWYDWDDIIDFDYTQPGLRRYMEQAMVHWVKEYNVDGFRCDVAGFVPIDFWEQMRRTLDTIKPVFMLAEWESRDLHHRAFDMTYGWSFYDALISLIKKKEGMATLYEYLAHDVSTFPRGGYRMLFTENHDKNSWDGTQYSNFGEGLPAATVLACTANGMPLVYSGQEAGLDRSLAFFEKDQIEWKEHPNRELYAKLFALKKRNRALWNGEHGGVMVRILNNKMDQVLSFARETDSRTVMVVINFSEHPADVQLRTDDYTGTYTELFSENETTIAATHTISLQPWGYRVYHKEGG
ncbi:MAG: alpha-amylase family glycosyl hydrolase [Balneolaceae bacterium]